MLVTISLGAIGLWEITRGHYELATFFTIAAVAWAGKSTYRTVVELRSER